MLGLSIDTPPQAARLAKDLALPFPILSDPRMKTIRAYGMQGAGMQMGEMGYVVIDKQGRIRTRRIDRRFGDNAGMIERAVREASTAPV